MDGPYKGKILHKSTEWTDPTRVKNLISYHKVDGPYKGKILHKSTKWTDPIRVKSYITPQSGRTQLG